MIGSAGTKAKCDWLKAVGFDHVFNYKETTVDEALKQMAADGIDLYFDNVSTHIDLHFDNVSTHTTEEMGTRTPGVCPRCIFISWTGHLCCN